MRLEFPWPPRELSPNSRAHWRVVARASKQYKRDCYYTAVSQGVTPLTSPVTAQVTFVNDRRRRDPDNCMASLKALWDALVDLQIIEDDNKDVLTVPAPLWEVGEPLVIVELEGA